MVKLARDLGSIEHLLPRHIDSLIDLPYSIAGAISFATTVLGWRENLASEEIPPRYIWLDGELVKEWFDQVQRDRERRWKGDAVDGEQNDAAGALVVGG